MYPAGFQTWVEVEQMTRPLEGAQRPRPIFRGVTTVVASYSTLSSPRKPISAEGCPAGGGHSANDQGFEFPNRIVVCPHSTRTGWTGHVQPANVYLDADQRKGRRRSISFSERGQSRL